MKLTTKQNAFVKVYISNGGNATQAAIQAGYSESSAHSIGEENLKKPAIKYHLDQHREKIAIRHDITVDYLIDKLEKSYELAMDIETVAPAVAAVHLMAKITGLDKQIIEHQGKIEHTMIEVEFITKTIEKDITE